MPFFYGGYCVSHVPDVDINFGLGNRIRLTYENAWLRVQNPFSETKIRAGAVQSWSQVVLLRRRRVGPFRLLLFPQAFLNNPNHAVRRGITSPSDSFELPAEFSKKLGPIDVDFEIGYQFVHNGPDGWLTGLVVGHDFTPKLEMEDAAWNPRAAFSPISSATSASNPYCLPSPTNKALRGSDGSAAGTKGVLRIESGCEDVSNLPMLQPVRGKHAAVF